MLSLMQRTRNVAPFLIFDFMPLWMADLWTCTVMRVPLGIFLLMTGVLTASGVALAAWQLSPIPDPPSTPTWITYVAGISSAGFGGLIAWVFIDRMGWAKREKQIEVNTAAIAKINEKLDGAVLDGPSRDEHKDLRERLARVESGPSRDEFNALRQLVSDNKNSAETGRAELLAAIKDLSQKIDRALEMAMQVSGK
jgi:hypothetical protein